MEGIAFDKKLTMVDKVLSGNKTMFRLVSKPKGNGKVFNTKYQIGQRIALLQAYKDIDIEVDQPVFQKDKLGDLIQITAGESRGWSNAKSVDPELMPHIIEIVSIKQESIKDISAEDCLKEGIVPVRCDDLSILDGNMPFEGFSLDGKTWLADSPQEVFSLLSDKLVKKNAWVNNKMVDVYEFKLVR